MMMLCLACPNCFSLLLVIESLVFYQASWVAEISMQNLGRLSLLGKGATVRVSESQFEIRDSLGETHLE